jgi:hypothetical protein
LRARRNGVVILKFIFQWRKPMRGQILLASVGAIAIAGNNWSLGAEYRYSDFGRFNDFPFSSLASVPLARHHLTENQVQAGFSYKFTPFAPAPVVAKY